MFYDRFGEESHVWFVINWLTTLAFGAILPCCQAWNSHKIRFIHQTKVALFFGELILLNHTPWWKLSKIVCLFIVFQNHKIIFEHWYFCVLDEKGNIRKVQVCKNLKPHLRDWKETNNDIKSSRLKWAILIGDFYNLSMIST